MAKKPETVFKERILPLLRRLPNTWAEKISQRSTRGTPDILLCVNGFFVALELKKDSKELPDPLQKHTLDKINIAGGIALAVSPENWPKVFKDLTALSKGETYDRDKIRAS